MKAFVMMTLICFSLTSHAFRISSDATLASHEGRVDVITYSDGTKNVRLNANGDLSLTFNSEEFVIAEVNFTQKPEVLNVDGRPVAFFNVKFNKALANWSWVHDSTRASKVKFSINFFHPNLKPLIIEWETFGCNDPVNQNAKLIINQKTIAAVKALLETENSELPEASLLKAMGISLDLDEAVELEFQVTEVNISIENAKNYFRTIDEEGFPVVKYKEFDLLHLINGNQQFKKINVALLGPNCR